MTGKIAAVTGGGAGIGEAICGTPEEVAAATAFLASDDAAYFVGATLSPNGGLVTAV